MIECTFRRERGRIASIESSGHAFYGSHGSDIVCAAVSVILQTVEIGLSQVAAAPPGVIKASGYLKLLLTRHSRYLSVAQDAISETALVMMRSIVELYPQNVSLLEISDDAQILEGSIG